MFRQESFLFRILGSTPSSVLQTTHFHTFSTEGLLLKCACYKLTLYIKFCVISFPQECCVICLKKKKIRKEGVGKPSCSQVWVHVLVSAVMCSPPVGSTETLALVPWPLLVNVYWIFTVQRALSKLFTHI